MRAWLAASVATVLLMAMATMTVAPVTAAAADDVLKICLDEDLPPLSAHRRGTPDSGFDVALAQAVAGRLGRPVHFQWLGSKPDEDSSPAPESKPLPPGCPPTPGNARA